MGKATNKTWASRPALVVLALALLFEVWVWDRLVAAVRWVLDRIPWAEFRKCGRERFNRWPAIISVLAFGVPFLVVEGGCTVSVILVAMGHVLMGALLYISLKISLLTMVALIFDITKERLLTLPWFVFVYDKLIKLHHYASALVAPYREGALRLMLAFLDQAQAWGRRLTVQWLPRRNSVLSEGDAD